VRFLIPVLPFLYFYFLVGAKWVSEKIFTNSLKIATRSLFMVVIFIGVTLIARNLLDWQNPVREQMTDLSIGASWIAENSPADSIVMVNEPVPAYVHVKRRTINFPKNDQGLEFYLNNQRIDYIIIAPLLQSPKRFEWSKDVKAIQARVEALPDIFKLVFEDKENNVRVYQYTGQ
ncbi:MAG TPA: hypothetical protein PLX14_15125, partial [Anaerolineales bacterium]|nr:hypothetical protein [Anaerolineales bacterium]